MSKDRVQNPSQYSVVLVSEGATYEGGDMIFEDNKTDAPMVTPAGWYWRSGW